MAAATSEPTPEPSVMPEPVTRKVYQAVWPLVVVKDSIGRVNQFYQGAILPDGIPAEELDRHLESGAVVAL